MKDNTITINGKPYEILFTCLLDDGQFLLLEDEANRFVVRYDAAGPTVENATPEEAEAVLLSFEQMLANTCFYEGIPYIKQMMAGGMELCSRQDDDSILYPFKNGQPIHLDPAGLKFVTSMAKSGLQENHEFMQDLKTEVQDPRKIHDAPVCELDGVFVYLDFLRNPSGALAFVRDGQAIVSEAERDKLLAAFRAWEKAEYESALAFTIENLV